MILLDKGVKESRCKKGRVFLKKGRPPRRATGTFVTVTGDIETSPSPRRKSFLRRQSAWAFFSKKRLFFPGLSFTRLQNGYTLIELLVVLAIMGLMAALAPPILRGTQRSLHEKSEVYHLAAQLETAHQTAVDSQTTIRVQLPAHGSVTFFPDGSATGVSFHKLKMIISVSPISGNVAVSGR